MGADGIKLSTLTALSMVLLTLLLAQAPIATGGQDVDVLLRTSPPFPLMGRPTNLLIEIRDPSSGELVKRASITIQIVRDGQLLLERDLIARDGTLRFLYRFSQEGNYQVNVLVTAINGKELTQPVRSEFVVSVLRKARGIARLSIQSAQVADIMGRPKAEIRPDELFLISTKLKNDGDESQQFLYLVQVKNARDEIVGIRFQQSLLTPGNEMTLGISFKLKEPGAYRVEVYIWKDMLTMAPLSKSQSLEVLVETTT